MKKIIVLILCGLALFSCKVPTATNGKLDHKSEVALKGNWTIVSVTYPGSEYFKATSFDLADSKCLIGSNWKFVSNNNKGNMATIGRNKAVVDLTKPNLSFQGFLAWIIWMTLHLFLLIGFKNKLIVFINWMYKYFTRHQSLSLIFKPLVRPKNETINYEVLFNY